MNSHHFDGIVEIEAVPSAQSAIFLYLTDYAGINTLVTVELDQTMAPQRDAMVAAINKVARQHGTLPFAPLAALQGADDDGEAA